MYACMVQDVHSIITRDLSQRHVPHSQSAKSSYYALHTYAAIKYFRADSLVARSLVWNVPVLLRINMDFGEARVVRFPGIRRGSVVPTLLIVFIRFSEKPSNTSVHFSESVATQAHRDSAKLLVTWKLSAAFLGACPSLTDFTPAPCLPIS